MTRLVVVAAAAIGLILFAAFVVARLLESRTRGVSIRMQVFLALALIVGAFSFGLGVMVIDRIEARAVRLATQAATDEAQSIAGIVQGELDRTGAGVGEVAARLEFERRRGADLRLELLDVDDRVLFPQGASSARGTPGTVTVDAPIDSAGRRIGAVRVVKPTIVMRLLLADFAPTVLVISLVLGAAAAISAALIGRSIARPIEALTQFAERVSSGERTAAPPAGAGREVMRLSRSIDSMRRQLEGRPFVETFAADLSHELKNPVAAIRASAEVLEESALDEPEEARRFVARIRESTARIERLLGDLLSLARIEARGVEQLERVDVGAVTRQVRDERGTDAARIQVTTEDDVRVRGDSSWLARAIGNLVDNALVHGKPNSDVRVTVARAREDVSVSVESEGAVPKHVRDNLFRRFVTTRPDKGGTGLGLAIVRAVAESHGGRAELMQPGPPRVVFALLLPPASRSAADELRAAVQDARRGVASNANDSEDLDAS
ncbi:MAG: HAMP domain-containing protein [Polyangiaceae bacterium]|nr:HAMP domain-containing protein [Polyangiaceae bacterium]